MGNGIPPSQYGRVPGTYAPQPAREVQPRTPAETTPASEPTRTAASRPAEGLTAAEQQMIDRYFPDAPSMALRIYGPGRTTHQVNPGAVGSRLDLRG